MKMLRLFFPLVAIIIGLLIGHSPGQQYPCLDPPCFPCIGLDGDPWGKKTSRTCVYDEQCSCGPLGKTPIVGWCQRDRCKKCYGQATDPTVMNCY